MSRRGFAVGVVAVLGVLGVSSARAQTHFISVQRTGDNAIIGIPLSAHPTIRGKMLSIGDEIGAFSPDGLCVGATVWTDTSAALTIWGDNYLTPQVDGLHAGESVSLRIWCKATGIEYTRVEVAFVYGSIVYVANLVSQVASLDVSVYDVEMGNFLVTPGVRSGTFLQWQTISEGSILGFEVQRSADPFLNFETLPNSFQPGHANTDSLRQYSFTDQTAPLGTWFYRLKVCYTNGVDTVLQSKRVEVVSAVQEKNLAPREFALEQNYPNPFNPSTTIEFNLTHASNIIVRVYNQAGAEVQTLLTGFVEAGIHHIRWNASHLASGTYFCQLQTAEGVRAVRKMLLVR